MSESYQCFEFVEVEPGFYSIEQDYVRSFLFVSDQEVLMIDLGMGGNDLLGQVRERWDLPIKVVFTHADMDHVGDANAFEQRFMHPSEFDYYYTKAKETSPMTPIWEGDVVDIGVYHFEVIHLPGHTPGSICLLDRKRKIMIGGDTIQSGPIFMFGPGRNFYAFVASMEKLLTMIDDIDWIYACHHDIKVSSDKINLLLEGAKDMISGRAVGEPEPRFEGKVKRYTTHGVSFYSL